MPQINTAYEVAITLKIVLFILGWSILWAGLYLWYRHRKGERIDKSDIEF